MVSERLGRYRIKGHLGSGGMGDVFLAADESLDRDVALKVLPESLAGEPSARVRLLREARLASRLNHPNICTVHEAGEEDGKAFLAMELVEGRSLSTRLREGPLAYPEALDLALQIAGALAHAHQRGVVHRDLKCANVMVTPDGRAKVLDFGLAKLLSADEVSEATRALEPPTAPGMVVGTLSYMPPESLRGTPPDARGDVWAFGVMAHEMVAGSRPFQGTTSFELCSAILHEPPKPLPTSLPEPFRALVERCLAKRSEERFQDGSELLRALTALGSATSGHQFRALPWLLGAAALLGLAVLAFRRPWLPVVPGGAQPALLSLAVLPLQDLSGRPEEAYLADGLHETLINDLSQYGGFTRVVQRQSVLRFQGSRQSMADIGKELGVEGLLTGSVLRSGPRIRVTTALVRVKGEETLWSHRFERDMADLLTLENELVDAIGKEVKGAVQVKASSVQSRNRRLNPEATEKMLRGRFEVNKQTPQGFSTGLKLLQEAAALDPSDARIQAALALGYGLAAHDDSGAKAGRDAALKAISLDDSIPDAHCALAMHRTYVEWDWRGAEAEFQRTLALNPNHPEARAHYGWLLELKGRPEEALREERAAVLADPLMPTLQGWLAWMLWDLGRTEEALQTIRSCHRVDPDNPWADFVLAQILAERGQPGEALPIAERAARKIPMFLAGVGLVHAKAGNRAECLKVIQEMRKGSSPMQCTFLAVLHGQIGDREEALAWTSRALEKREPWGPFMFADLHGFQRSLAGLRSDPRFQAQARRAKLEGFAPPVVARSRP